MVDDVQRFYDLTTALISVAPSGLLERGAHREYHDALNALIQLRDRLRREKTVKHNESYWKK